MFGNKIPLLSTYCVALLSSSELMSSEANPPSGDSEIDFDSGSCTPYTKAWTTITYWTVQVNKKL